MSDDILDSMSLSDDELLDSLADDMLAEMEEESAHIAAPSAVPAQARADPMQVLQAMPARPNQPAMPDLGQMMSQMMPMMSQLLGGGGAGARGAPGNQLPQPVKPWQQVVREHVPSTEQAEWIETMQADEVKQQRMYARSKPLSRSYNDKAKSSASRLDLLMANLLTEAVRASRANPQPQWKRDPTLLAPELTQSGLAQVFARQLKEHLRRRVQQDDDYQEARKDNAARFGNIAAALSV